MAYCALIDYSERPASTIELYEYLAVTQDDIAEIRDSIPPAHMEKVEEGDFLVVYIVDNRIEGIIGILTVWYNKTIACIDTGNGAVWGDWELDKELVVTGTPEEAQDNHGMIVKGRVAYNNHGIRGIYSGGRFYTMRKPVPDADPDDTDEGAGMEPSFLCHDEETHGVHICQLKQRGAAAAEIKHFAKDPRVSCLLCEALANSADHVCSPVEFD